MVGEVRDPETAKIAIQASLTGHLVMTTLHTNTAAAAVTRLVDIGVERYLIASTLSAVVGQRLVRTLCLDCRAAVHGRAGATASAIRASSASASTPGHSALRAGRLRALRRHRLPGPARDLRMPRDHRRGAPADPGRRRRRRDRAGRRSPRGWRRWSKTARRAASKASRRSTRCSASRRCAEARPWRASATTRCRPDGRRLVGETVAADAAAVAAEFGQRGLMLCRSPR